MNKTTDFLNLPILSIADSAIVGEVKAVYFDNDAKQALYLALSWNEKEMLLPFDKICCKADSIVIDSKISLVDACDVDMTSLVAIDLKPIYSQNGEFKGKALEVELFASGKTSKIISENAQYNPSAFQKFGGVLLLKQAKKRTGHRTIPKDKTDRKVEIFDKKETSPKPEPAKNETIAQNAITTNNIVIMDEVQPQKPAFLEQGSPMFSQDALEKIVGKEVVYADDDDRTPARIISDYDFLLGRTLLHDLNTYAGTLLAKEGSLVTKELVETAARHGKLVDLTLNSSYK